MDLLLLLDGVEDYQYLLAVLVHVLLQHLGLIVESKVLFVLPAQFCDLLLAVITLDVLLKVADLVVKIEELTIGRCEMMRLMQVKHLIDLYLRLDLLQFLLKIVELIVQRHVFDDQ